MSKKSVLSKWGHNAKKGALSTTRVLILFKLLPYPRCYSQPRLMSRGSATGDQEGALYRDVCRRKKKKDQKAA